MDTQTPSEQHWLQECDALRLRTEDRQRQIDSARQLLEMLEAQQCADDRMLEEIEGLLNRHPQLRIESLDKRLQGERLREIAKDIIVREFGRGVPVHYRDWYRMLRQDGYGVSGKDPLASFLTQVSRDPSVERVPLQRGFYRVLAPTS